MKILLFSDRKKVFEITNNIIKDWSELIWYKYTDWERKKYPLADIVIIDFDKTYKVNESDLLLKKFNIYKKRVPNEILNQCR